jgi:hypothetical protein
MNKIEREKIKEQRLIELIGRTEAINGLTAKTEPYVERYWNLLKDLWERKIGYNEAGRIKDCLIDRELKELNKNYRKLLN